MELIAIEFSFAQTTRHQGRHHAEEGKLHARVRGMLQKRIMGRMTRIKSSEPRRAKRVRLGYPHRVPVLLSVKRGRETGDRIPLSVSQHPMACMASFRVQRSPRIMVVFR